MTLLYFFMLLLALLPFYLIGAIPTGYLISRHYGVDIKTQGSGNVGATNVMRVIGKRQGVLTLGIDTIKGTLAVLLSMTIWSSTLLHGAAALCVVAGHCFSIPGTMKGGKGVATALGVLLALDWILAIGALIVFSLVFFATRIVSLASVSAVLITPIVGFMRPIPESYQAALAGIALLVVFRHKENLTRLSRGEEPSLHSNKREPQLGAS